MPLEKNDLISQEGHTLSLKGDKTRVRFTITDTWSGEVFRFELGQIGANILANFIKQALESK